jgi:hypothetical protein
VSAETSRVETGTTQVGQWVSAAQIASIPVNGRGYTDLLALQPGVISASSR